MPDSIFSLQCELSMSMSSQPEEKKRKRQPKQRSSNDTEYDARHDFRRHAAWRCPQHVQREEQNVLKSAVLTSDPHAMIIRAVRAASVGYLKKETRL